MRANVLSSNLNIIKFLRHSVRRAHQHHELGPTLRFGKFMVHLSPLLGIFPAGSPGGETECQYLSGRQYSALWQVQCTFYPRAVCNNFLNN